MHIYHGAVGVLQQVFCGETLGPTMAPVPIKSSPTARDGRRSAAGRGASLVPTPPHGQGLGSFEGRAGWEGLMAELLFPLLGATTASDTLLS